MHNKSAKVARECWRLPETASSIVHHVPLLFLPSRHTTIYTQRIIQVFLLAAGCDWLNGPNMAECDWLTARENVSFEKTDRGSKQAGRSWVLLCFVG